ncbi:hypothetical protein HBB16_01100 [Pseudonocardia sp. MCCB 268]|nr:hypothetical protein [Pseudonocardia cytotoxica]
MSNAQHGGSNDRAWSAVCDRNHPRRSPPDSPPSGPGPSATWPAGLLGPVAPAVPPNAAATGRGSARLPGLPAPCADTGGTRAGDVVRCSLSAAPTGADAGAVAPGADAGAVRWARMRRTTDAMRWCHRDADPARYHRAPMCAVPPGAGGWLRLPHPRPAPRPARRTPASLPFPAGSTGRVAGAARCARSASSASWRRPAGAAPGAGRPGGVPARTSPRWPRAG